jgi:cyclopropane fatty-acyl-phospholipid synthase-like methyltransferase
LAIDDVKWGVGSTGSAKQGDRRGRKPRYPETARLWNQNFDANRDWILQLGNPYDQRFLRMWSYYLQLLRGVLDSGDLQLYQVLFGQQSSRAASEGLDFHSRAIASA